MQVRVAVAVLVAVRWRGDWEGERQRSGERRNGECASVGAIGGSGGQVLELELAVGAGAGAVRWPAVWDRCK